MCRMLSPRKRKKRIKTRKKTRIRTKKTRTKRTKTRIRTKKTRTRRTRKRMRRKNRLLGNVKFRKLYILTPMLETIRDSFC